MKIQNTLDKQWLEILEPEMEENYFKEIKQKIVKDLNS
jgi:uracil DNA glycosylase